MREPAALFLEWVAEVASFPLLEMWTGAVCRENSQGGVPTVLTVLIWLSPVSVGIAGGAGVICGHAANSIRHSGEAEGCMDGLDAVHLLLPQPGAHGGTAVGGWLSHQGAVCVPPSH